MKRKLLETFAWLLCTLQWPRFARYSKYRSGKVTVLCLHRISDEPSIVWPPIPVAVFDDLCKYWSTHYIVTSFGGLNFALAHSKKPVLILSFDDGYKDFFTNALPILKKYKLSANLNIVTRCAKGDFQIWTQLLNNFFDAAYNGGAEGTRDVCSLGAVKLTSDRKQLSSEYLRVIQLLARLPLEDRFQSIRAMGKHFNVEVTPTPMMQWEEIRSASRQGIEIGSHTDTHDMLNFLSDEDLNRELVASRESIRRHLGEHTRIIAFPNGGYSNSIATASKTAGYDFWLTSDEMLYKKSSSKPCGILPRLLLHRSSYYQSVLETENIFNRIKAFNRP